MTRAYNTATTQQNSGGAVAGVTAGKNAIINGGMDIWQRGTSSFTTTFGYTADRWFTYKAAGSHTITRQVTGDTTNLPFVQYSARVQRNSGQTNTDRTQFYQCFETVSTIPYAGKTVTISFYARKGANFSPTSSQLEYYFGTGTGTDQQPINGYTGSASVAAGNIVLTSTWQRFTITGTLTATATEMFFGFLCNWTGTAGADDWYEVTGVQLEVGSVATPFSRAGGTIAGELAACQRYYEQYTSAGSDVFGIGYTQNSTTNRIMLPMVAKRTTPTVTYAGGLQVILGGGSSYNVTSIANINSGGSNMINFNAVIASGGTAGGAGALYANGATVVMLGAEL